jgi:cytochrome b involved in lipid metabolism
MGPYYSREHPASDLMARVVGKNATVTFEVISTDQETEQLLQQTLTNMVGGLLKQDKDRLKAALSTSPLPKQKPTSEAPEPRTLEVEASLPFSLAGGLVIAQNLYVTGRRLASTRAFPVPLSDTA